jgi:hypothetical protein
MSKIMALFGLTVMVGLLALTASSASALFGSGNGKATTGKGSAGEVTFTDQSATVSCKTAEGEWKLAKPTQAKTVSIHINASNASTPGWKECKTSISSMVEVSECELQEIQQTKRPRKATSTVVVGCTSTAIGNCRIKVSSGKGVNEELEEIATENSGTELVSKLNVKGIASEAEVLGGGGCTGISELKNNKGNESGEIKGVGLKEE